MRKKPMAWAYSILVVLAVWSVQGQGLSRQAQPPGYLESVSEERHLRVVELTMVSEPSDPLGPTLHEQIFNEQLSTEFERQYEERFGRTSAEQQIFNPSRFDEYEYASGLSVSFEEDQENRRRFGEYMMRRLVEFHVDSYAKSNPSVRPAYELKDRIGNIDLEVRQDYRLRLRYSYSGNFLDVHVDNPYELDTRLTLLMNPDSFGPSRIEDTILQFKYPLERGLTLSYHYKFYQGVWSLVGAKKLSEGLSATLSGSTYAEDLRQERDIRQNLVLIGLSWVH